MPSTTSDRTYPQSILYKVSIVSHCTCWTQGNAHKAEIIGICIIRNLFVDIESLVKAKPEEYYCHLPVFVLLIGAYLIESPLSCHQLKRKNLDLWAMNLLNKLTHQVVSDLFVLKFHNIWTLVSSLTKVSMILTSEGSWNKVVFCF